jgi:hypothetical protein
MAIELEAKGGLKPAGFDAFICGMVAMVGGLMTTIAAYKAAGEIFAMRGAQAELAAVCASGGGLTMAICGLVGAAALVAASTSGMIASGLTCAGVMDVLKEGHLNL